MARVRFGFSKEEKHAEGSSSFGLKDAGCLTPAATTKICMVENILEAGSIFMMYTVEDGFPRALFTYDIQGL